MFSKEMMDALMADAEKLQHLTGEDHTPEFLVTCEACDGAGEIVVNDPPVSKWSLDPPGVHEVTCEVCCGNGFLVCEMECDQ